MVVKEGEWISLNGSTGEVILGSQPLSPPAVSGDLETFMSWADKLRRLKVMHAFMLYRRVSFLLVLFEFNYVTWDVLNV